METKRTGRLASAFLCFTGERHQSPLSWLMGQKWSPEMLETCLVSTTPAARLWSQRLGCILPRGDASTLSPWAELVSWQYRVGGWDAEK